MSCYIYQFYNTNNGKIYIGKTNNIKRRLEQHLSISKSSKEKYGHHYQVIHAALAKHKKNIEFSIIQELFCKKEADECEIYWIKYFRSNNPKYGYNLTAGGDGGTGIQISEMTRSKMRAARLGKILSNESKLKISVANSGKALSEEHKIKISNGNKGKKLSDGHKLSLIKSNINKIVLDTTKQKISKTLTEQHLVGDKNPNASITNEGAEKIKKFYATGSYTQKQLGIMFNIHQTTISLIVNNKHYNGK